MTKPYFLYGSQAIKHWFSDFYRKPTDTDIICEDKSRFKGTDVKYAKCFDNLLNSEQHNIKNIASPNALYTIKVSHSFFPVHWEKTMRDISFLQNKKCSLIRESYNELYEFWCEFHKAKSDKSRMNFNVPNEKFFKPTVDRKFQHDLLHKLIKFNNKPMYSLIKNDPKMAQIDENLFNKLSTEQKRELILEEVYVIALERFLIPNSFNFSFKKAYLNSLKMNIINLNKGFIPLYIVENWNYFRHFDLEKFEKQIFKVQKLMRVW